MLNAGAMWASTDSTKFDQFRLNPAAEPDMSLTLKLEFTIMKDDSGIWTNGGNISYVEGVLIPVLMYFGPGKIQEIDDNPEGNNKLVYTTCTQKQLQDDCPTMVNSSGMCISPDLFCLTANQGKPNWTEICDDEKGAMSVYIKKFKLDQINSSLYRHTTDETYSTLSRFIYNNGNPFNNTGAGTQLGSFYWPTPDMTGATYQFSDDQEKQMFVGTVVNGNIVGGPLGIQPAPTGDRITAFNSVMNSWAIARGMCDPYDLVNNCGGQGGDYMARYTQPSADKNNFTKGDTNLTTNTQKWHTGEFPDNVYAKYVTEHTHLAYGFPYDEGPYGGYTSCNPKEKPQMCIMFFPECKSIDSIIK
jgi:hypothetical protein